MIGIKGKSLKPSATMAMSAKAKSMIRGGVDVKSLAAGEPDFSTPDHIVEAGLNALRNGHTRYTPAAGIPELREQAAQYINCSSGTHRESHNVNVTCGAKQALFNTMFVTLDPGDKVIIPAPCWVTYPVQVELCGATPVIIPPNADGTLNIAGIADEVSSAKAIILCNPSNPTGQVLSEDDLKFIGALAREHNLLVVTDEIYSELVYAPTQYSAFLRVCPDLEDQTVVIHGVSKTFAMTGWRIGFVSGPTKISKAISALMSQSTSNPNAAAQWGALEALTKPKDFLNDWKATFQGRRDLLVDGLNQLPGVLCRKPGGAFYVFPDVRGVMDRAGLSDDIELAERILEEAHVATVPGSPFHAPGHIRLSYATGTDVLEESLSRLQAWIEAL